MFDRIVAFLAPEASAERLALWRIAVAGFVAVYATARSPVFVALTRRSAAELDPVGPWFFLDNPLADGPVIGLLVVTVAGAALVAGGVAHRVTGPMFGLATLGLLAYRSCFGQILWFEHLIALHALVVGFSPAADAWRAGRWTTGPSEPSTRYGQPLRLGALLTLATYWLAGLAKLRIGGSEWFAGETLANHIGFSARRLEVFGERGPLLAGEAVALGPWLAIAAAGAVLLELLAPVAMFGGRWRTAWIVGIVLMHAGIALTMSVVFPYHLTAIGLVPLVEAAPSRWRWWPGRGSSGAARLHAVIS